MCSLAPRLTGAATNSRIHIHALSDVTSVTGPPGEFNVTVRHRARYVNEKCVGCGECAAVCPVTYPNEFDFGVSERTAIFRPFANAVPATFAVDRKGWSPCKTACPVHTSAHGYVALVAKGRYEEAYRVASEPNPFPSVCGRICTHVCETECTRGDVDDPVAIAGIKRFVADTGAPAEPPAPLPVFYDEPVAIVGAGPAGLTRRPRARAVRLQGDRVRGAPGRRRHAARRHPRVPPAAPGAAGRDRPHHRPGRRAQDGRRAAAPISPSTRSSPTATRRVFLATGLHQSKDLPLDGLGPAGRRARRRVPARAGARRARRPPAKRVVVVRRRRRGLRRRPHGLPLRRRRSHPRLHRRRAHGAGLVRGGRRGQGRAGPRRVTRAPARDPGQGRRRAQA